MKLSVAEASELRADFADFAFDDLATFMRLATPTDTDFGQASKEPDEVVLADVPCRVGTTQAQAAENETGGQVQSKMRVKLFFPFGTTKPLAADYAIITTQNNRRIDVSESVWVTGMLSEELDGIAQPLPEVVAVSGDAILDSDGAEILDSDGEAILDEAA